MTHTVEPPTIEALQNQIDTLQEHVDTLAWLHAGLVHELRALIAQLALTRPNTARQMRDPTLMARAKRIADLRAEQAEQWRQQ